MLTYNHFLPAYMFFSIAGLWTVIFWQVSDYLNAKSTELQKQLQRFKKKPTKQKTIVALKKARRAYWLSNMLGSCAIFALTVACLVWTRTAQTEYELSLLSGWLIPAGDADPPSFCAYDVKDPNALKVFMGRNEAFSSKFPYVALRVYKKDRMIIDRDENGRVALNLDILDNQRKVITTFEKGRFTVDQSNILDMKRPDRSTLIVRDQYKNEVLNVRYLNRTSLQISGVLRYPGAGVISIPKTSAVNGMCAGNAEVAFDIE